MSFCDHIRRRTSRVAGGWLLDFILHLATVSLGGRTSRRVTGCALLVAGGWLLPVTNAAAQPAAVSDDYLLQKWDADDGLPDNAVTAITQTRDGYLWIGTQRGLARFDGVRFCVFNAENTSALASNNVRCLAEDQTGTLWIGLGQSDIVRCRDGTFATVAPPGAAPTNWLTSLACDASGAMWAGFSDFRALRWTAGRWQAFGAADGLTGTGAVTCVADTAGKIWFTTETSYGYFDGEKFVTLAADVSFPQLVPRRAGNFWLAPAKVFPEIQIATEDRAGVLWIGTKGRGLFRYANEEAVRVLTSHDYITALHEDREGNLWVGTWGGGLDRIRPRHIRLHDERSGLPADMIYSICQDGEGAMWFATRSAGVVRLLDGQFTNFTATNGWPGGIATTLCADHNGGVWLGTLLTGLLHWQSGAFTNVGVSGEQIESLLEDHRGTLWIGTARHGLLQLRDGQLTTNAGPREVTALAEDAAGNLWIGTRTGALWRHGEVGFKQFDTGTNALQAIYAGFADYLLIGTRGGGVVVFRNDKNIGKKNLPDDDVRQILRSDAGYFWFGTRSGLIQLPGSIKYGRSEGLGSLEFVEGFHNAACRARDGHLWFATLRGALEVNPVELLAAAAPPPVLIEESRVDSRTREVALRYTALGLSAPEAIRFRYRLKNVDATWIDAGTERVATFPRLSPGRYDFEVTARNSTGDWNPTPATFSFVVRAAWWQTIWFRIVAALLLAAVAAASVRVVSLRRVRRRLQLLEHEHALEAERARIAKNMHDDLGARLTRIALLSEQVREDAALAPNTATRVEKISHAAHDLAQTLDEIVWTVNPGNDTLERLIGYLSEYAAEFLAATAIKLMQELPEAIPALPISAEVRHNLLLAVKEALHNAVKHAAASEIALKIAIEPTSLRVAIADNGKGFAPATPRSIGHGLSNLRQRLATAGGVCAIDSAPGKGTRIVLTLPLKNER